MASLDREELIDELASFVAVRGARGVVVFDGVGEEHEVGLLAVRFAQHADTLLERLAATHRLGESVLLVTSDAAMRGTSGQEVRKRGSAGFLAELGDGRASRGVVEPAWAIGSTRRRERASSACAARKTEHGGCQAAGRTCVLITLEVAQRGCNARKKVLASPST